MTTGRWMIAAAALLLAGGCAAMQPAKTADPAERIKAIAAKIREAETLGARECVPRDLAKAQVAMEHVRHEVEEGYYAPSWIEPDLAAADIAAEQLVIERRVAARLGGGRFRCVAGTPKVRPARRSGG